jgi:hypothetical protein
VNLHTWTGWGSVTHWNAFVANIEMHGKGTFFDPRLDDADQFPIAARNKFGHISNEKDRITPKLAALHASCAGHLFEEFFPRRFCCLFLQAASSRIHLEKFAGLLESATKPCP